MEIEVVAIPEEGVALERTKRFLDNFISAISPRGDFGTAFMYEFSESRQRNRTRVRSAASNSMISCRSMWSSDSTDSKTSEMSYTKR